MRVAEAQYEEYLHALKASGFGASVAKEAWPADECRTRYPQIYEKLSSRPSS